MQLYVPMQEGKGGSKTLGRVNEVMFVSFAGQQRSNSYLHVQRMIDREFGKRVSVCVRVYVKKISRIQGLTYCNDEQQ